MKVNAKRLLLAILLCQIVGNLGSFFTFPALASWYGTLHKPAFTLPNWVFAPAWLTLYTLMGVSLYLVWEKEKRNRKVRKALMIFSIQLALNFLWSFLFFGLRSPLYGFAGIFFLWLAIIITTVEFFKISRNAGALLLPYISWVSFALILNLYIFLLN